MDFLFAPDGIFKGYPFRFNLETEFPEFLLEVFSRFFRIPFVNVDEYGPIEDHLFFPTEWLLI